MNYMFKTLVYDYCSYDIFCRFVTQTRYTGAALNSLEFYNRSSLLNLQTRNETMDKSFACYNEKQNQNDPINSFAPFGCR